MIDFDLTRLLRMPDICKPAQLVNGLILMICIGTATQVSGVGFLWFIIIVQFITSAVATVLFAVGMQDMIVASLVDRSLPWSIIEMSYSLVFAILSGVSVWLSLFKFHSDPKATVSGGYIAGAIFFVLQAGLYAQPAYVYYQHNRQEEERNREITANPRNLDNSAPQYGYQA